MALLGSLVKTSIELNQKLSFGGDTPSNLQKKQLKKLLEKAQNTAFGKYYDFTSLLDEQDLVKSFKERVPIFDYDDLNERWWSQQQQFPDITWPGKPDFFALSSGTTGKSSKRIPITADFLQSMRAVGTSLIKALPNFNFPEELFESEILMLSSSANLSKHENGHQEGEISGINVSNFPGWYDLFYRPGVEIAAISDWDERVRRIVKEAPEWNIGAIAGIPSWVLLLLKEIIASHGLKNIHDLWPNLTVYASGGVAFDTYRKDFEAISGKPLTIMDTYLASEGFFAYTARPGAMDMELALDHGYFYEFIPFDHRGVDEQGGLLEHPESHNLDQVIEGQEYVLIVSSCAGAWRYMIGDTIKFTSLDPVEIRITGRTKFFLNTVGSQLSEEKMDKAIVDTSDQLGIKVNEYIVAALKEEHNETYYHQWVIVSDDNIDTTLFVNTLDDTLQESNKNYRVARNKALKDVKLKVISKSTYHSFLEKKKKKGGQVKTPKVMSANAMSQLLEVT
ncbi:GH3 auxin-responsive promoter family protein [Fulvivirga sp. M361]|uniref:GH3 family domain-containing protein n=1 Tax=Fulvivirga sp. M361 TaxID=2594266 RepID=UPI00117B7D41|nr:GH3 auxin-responsive promoter family protein [Fulvivirga sp. M361]TRX60546.1 GH3 auxin-responsive promoter family protein [Fulvivirga sp. M361]